MISNSGHDENGKYSGGKAGDQTGEEWSIIKWYNRPWLCVLRHTDENVQNMIADMARSAANNNKIGYDQGQRTTFWTQLQKSGYDPAKITTACEADCSAGVAAIVKATGYRLGVDKLKNVSKDAYTGNLRAVLKNAGFTCLTASKYLTSDKYLLPGDVLLYDGHHTAINLDTGSAVKNEKEEESVSKKYIDISHHHPVSDWDKIKANCPFIITKATQGTSYVDGTLYDVIKKCEAKKIPYWLYAYLNKGDELAQAKYMVSICKDKVGDCFVGYILDIEEGNNPTNCKKALQYLQSLNVKTMIYTGYSKYSSYRTLITERGDACAWWEARYGLDDGTYSSKYPCHSGVDLHQFTSSGSCPGISDKIDLNRITGQGKSESWFTTALSGSESEKIEGVNYFAPLQSSKVKDITTFLHNRGLGAGQANLSSIASANCQSSEVKEALFALAAKGLLIRPSGLNKWSGE